jgi:CheY-like chemotaxis protein
MAHPALPAQRGETVLVVDDEPSVRMLVTDMLRELGYTPLEAPDGPTALEMLRGGMRIDLLISDVGLHGGLNGRQVAEEARLERPGLAVLFITGYAETIVLDKGELQPGMQVMTKPFAMEDLARQIRTMLSQETMATPQT